jgi:hypothetical protein
MIALAGEARRWEPKRLHPWAADITAAVTRLQAFPPADQPEPTRR